jgi:hypothetical protein
MRVLVATADGLHDAEKGLIAFGGRDVTALARRGDTVWALVDGTDVHTSEDWAPVGSLPGLDGTCLLALDDGSALIGTAEAHLVHLTATASEPIDGFDAAPGRDDWFTPWGGPPDTRSLALDTDGVVYANVHVGGILRSEDARTWTPTTLPIDADVHEVRAADGHLLAACADGLASSTDGGNTWETTTDGLDATYMRAVSVAGDRVVATSSRGPGGAGAAVYARPLNGSRPFERLTDGLPADFTGNIDTGWLDAIGDTVVLVTPDGDVYRSDSAGRRWDIVASGLPSPRWLCLAPLVSR